MKSVTVEFSDSKLATVIVDVVDKSISDSEINQILSLIDVSKKDMLQQTADMIYNMGLVIVDVVDYPSGGIQHTFESTIESFKNKLNYINEYSLILSEFGILFNSIIPYDQMSVFGIVDLITSMHFV